jgi:ATP-dependent RNA helicase MSS116
VPRRLASSPAHASALTRASFATGFPVYDIHSRKSQSARTKTSEQFKNALAGVLFSSDVSARGMDYPDVTFVLQVGAASSKEQYVHRTGRSARAGKSGIELVLLCDFERFFLRELKGIKVRDPACISLAHKHLC